MERLHKLIAASGLASRRQAEELIRQGKVRVNGKTISRLGSLADPDQDQITVQGISLPRVETVTYALNKPRGIVCSRRRQDKERLVTDLVPAHPAVYPVGRLDKDSEGLILLTNNGELTQELTHPSFSHEKEYLVKAEWKEKAGDTAAVGKRLLNGVKLGDGEAKADKLRITPQADGSVELLITVHEGRNHLIRRMCASVGLDIRRLTRLRLGHLSVKGLKSGEYRRLSNEETKRLHAAKASPA